MAWGSAFREEIAKKRSRPRFVLEVAPVRLYLSGAGLNLSSHKGIDGYPSALTPQGSSITGGQLHVGDWSCTTGELSIGIRSNIDIRQRVPRGVLVALRMGFAGWDVSAYERVFLGQVQDVRWTGTQWQLQARSMLGALITRFSQTPLESSLFYELAETTLAEIYTAGEADIDLTSVTGLARISGDDYLIQITPDEGDPFFLTANGISTNTVTGCSASGQLGTTAAAAASGNTVVLCAFIERHPVLAALTVLTSTGVGDNGPYDVAPESWGFGLPREYIDLTDCIRTIAITNPASGSTLWDVYSAGVVDDGASWLRGLLAPGGMWLCDRQGDITIRAAEAVGQWAYEVESIRDEEIVEIRYSAWDPTQPAEYGNLTIRASSGAGSGTLLDSLDSRPAITTREVTWPYCEENENEWALRGVARLAAYSSRVGESFEITLSGWRLAHLAPGDHVIVSSRFVKTRFGIEGLALVTSCQADWFGSTTTLRVLHIQSAAEYAGS